MAVNIEAPRNHPAETELAWETESPIAVPSATPPIAVGVSHFKLFQAGRSDALEAGYNLIATIPNRPDAGRIGYSAGAIAPRGGARRSKVHYAVGKTEDLTWHYKVQRIQADGTVHPDDVTFDDDLVVRSVLSFEESHYYGNAGHGNRPMAAGRVVIVIPASGDFGNPTIVDFVKRHGRPACRLRINPDDPMLIRMNNVNNDEIAVDTPVDPNVPFQLGDEGSDGSNLWAFRLLIVKPTAGVSSIEIVYSYLTQ